MTTVLDIGAMRYGGDYSVERLIAEFDPDVLYAIDPNLAGDTPREHMDGLVDGQSDLGHAKIIPIKAAAWIYDGEIGFVSAGLTSWLTDAPEKPKTPCLDLARFIRDLPSDGEIVCKLDVEGSEVELLEHLTKTRTDELIKLLWVEAHCTACGRGGGGHRPGCEGNPEGERRWQRVIGELSCEFAAWNW